MGFVNARERSPSDGIERRGLMEALDTSQALIWFDASGVVVDANTNALELFAYSPDEIRKQDYYALCGTGARRLLAEKREWNRICSGEIRHNERCYSAQNKREIWTSVNFAVLKHPDGSARRVLGIFIDMSRFAWKPNDVTWAGY